LCHYNGLNAIGFKGLSKLEVFTLGLPIIANVRRNAVSSDFDHWVCVLAAEGDLYLFDNMETGRRITFGELAAIWNGYGIVVSKEPVAVQVIIARIAFFGIFCWVFWYLIQNYIISCGCFGDSDSRVSVWTVAVPICSSLLALIGLRVTFFPNATNVSTNSELI